jgi:hypothetical protein
MFVMISTLAKYERAGTCGCGTRFNYVKQQNKKLPILECKKPFVEKEDFLFDKRPAAKISF